jgi:IS1 family transposase
MLGVHRDTVMRLGARVGEGCAMLLDEKMRDLPCERLELDELWAFIGKKQRHVTANDDPTKGDVWTWVAIDATTKLVPTFMTGKRDADTANAFIKDLAARLRNRVQVTTDGLRTYVAPIAEAFGTAGVDYAQLHKTYEAEATGPGRYSPPKVTATEKTPVFGFPVEELVSTSYVERQNLTMRMGIRRFTNAHSKKLENHGAAVALHFAHYNLVRIHSTIRCTPAMAAGVESTVWNMGDLLDAALERTETP